MKYMTTVHPADDVGIDWATRLLRRGDIVALPTETVYGIAADARQGEIGRASCRERV